jgi:hypothetical protein
MTGVAPQKDRIEAISDFAITNRDFNKKTLGESSTLRRVWFFLPEPLVGNARFRGTLSVQALKTQSGWKLSFLGPSEHDEEVVVER